MGMRSQNAQSGSYVYAACYSRRTQHQQTYGWQVAETENNLGYQTQPTLSVTRSHKSYQQSWSSEAEDILIAAASGVQKTWTAVSWAKQLETWQKSHHYSVAFGSGTLLKDTLPRLRLFLAIGDNCKAIVQLLHMRHETILEVLVTD